MIYYYYFKRYDIENDEMLQCFFCQDWFHVECIENHSKLSIDSFHSKLHPQETSTSNNDQPDQNNVKYMNNETTNLPKQEGNEITPNSTDNEDGPTFQFVPQDREDECNMICMDCTEKYPFLFNYFQNLILPPGLQFLKDLVQLPTKETKQNDNQEETKNEKSESPEDLCEMPNLQFEFPKFNTFWVNDWRKKLCYCSACKQKYQENAISFIEEDEQDDDELVSSDTVFEDLETVGLSKLQQECSHEQQIEILRGFNMLTDNFKEFLKPLQESGTVVTKDVC